MYTQKYAPCHRDYAVDKSSLQQVKKHMQYNLTSPQSIAVLCVLQIAGKGYIMGHVLVLTSMVKGSGDTVVVH